MQCRTCGTEIAERAIVCYRCGAATTDPVRKPVSVRPRSGLLWPTISIAILLIAALYMGQASRTAADPERWQTVAGVFVIAAIMVLVLRLLRRRR